ncbi:c-type cytochrome [Devosia sp. CN2-171]|jgi:mono/diheme cytochrome c family protein|uniref:c-type cytochrome n=1 Tax=Devosia sp. CN2-171 TaxID=3400909 RepID=UPI003BF85783
MRLSPIPVVLALLAAPAHAGEPGELLFNDNCSGCHQLAGMGSPGLAPPLVDGELWGALGDKTGRYFAGVLMGGLSGTIVIQGNTYAGLAMPAQEWMSDEDMSAVADYVLNDLNGLDLAISPERFAEMRAAPLTHAELRSLRKGLLP